MKSLRESLINRELIRKNVDDPYFQIREEFKILFTKFLKNNNNGKKTIKEFVEAFKTIIKKETIWNIKEVEVEEGIELVRFSIYKENFEYSQEDCIGIDFICDFNYNNVKNDDNFEYLGNYETVPFDWEQVLIKVISYDTFVYVFNGKFLEDELLSVKF